MLLEYSLVLTLTPFPRVQVIAFAEDFYRHGSESFKDLGSRVVIDGKSYSHSEEGGLGGGFVTKTEDLKDALLHLDKGHDMMFTRINRLDDMGAQMHELAVKMAQKVRQGTDADTDSSETAEIVKQSKEMLKSWEKGVNKL